MTEERGNYGGETTPGANPCWGHTRRDHMIAFDNLTPEIRAEIDRSNSKICAMDVLAALKQFGPEVVLERLIQINDAENALPADERAYPPDDKLDEAEIAAAMSGPGISR